MIDTSLMPQITVRIQFTIKGVLGISNGTTFATFATSTTLPKEAFHFKTMDRYAVVEIVSAGAAYDTMQERIMSTIGYIPVPYKRVHCFQGGMNEGDVRFNIAPRSLDRIYFAPTAARLRREHPTSPTSQRARQPQSTPPSAGWNLKFMTPLDSIQSHLAWTARRTCPLPGLVSPRLMLALATGSV
jgi:hypothetical protein